MLLIILQLLVGLSHKVQSSEYIMSELEDFQMTAGMQCYSNEKSHRARSLCFTASTVLNSFVFCRVCSLMEV